jgi:hypothetical protein
MPKKIYKQKYRSGIYIVEFHDGSDRSKKEGDPYYEKKEFKSNKTKQTFINGLRKKGFVDENNNYKNTPIGEIQTLLEDVFKGFGETFK